MLQHIVVLVGADRHVVRRNVGQFGQRALESGVEFALHGLGALQEGLDLADLGLELLGQRHVLVAHGVADLLGGGVAALLALLQLAEMGAPVLVERHQFVDLGLRLVHGPLPLHQGFGESRGIVANPFDVEHVRRFPDYAQTG